MIVDTSVVIKWAIEEEGADAARELIGQPLIAPDLLLFELGHVLTKKVRRRELDRESAAIANVEVPKLLQLVPSQPYGPRAFELAVELHHSIYDCYFLALAEVAQLSLITADELLVRKLRRIDPAAPVRLLGED